MRSAENSSSEKESPRAVGQEFCSSVLALHLFGLVSGDFSYRVNSGAAENPLSTVYAKHPSIDTSHLYTQGIKRYVSVPFLSNTNRFGF